MREIKFRAWDKLKKIMLNNVEGMHFDISESGVEQIYALSTSKEFELNWRPINIIELMQYTGLKDKNGKEIYEGDIVRWYEVPVENIISGSVYWHKSLGTWFIKSIIEYHLGLVNMGGCEVIGNKFENPELIK